jgi:cyclophilin family peptidyl-prolyl cis-trans isomerase
MSRWIILLTLAGLFASCARPIARFTIEDKERVAPVTIQFSNQSEKAESYEWDFGDGNSSTESEPTHRYLMSGNYSVKLKATKGNRTTVKEQIIQVKPPVDCLVEIQTNFGNMLVKLYDETPKHRDNFIKLAEQGYFNDLLFHRVIEGFMIQGGDPNSRGAEKGVPLGMGGPGYTVDAEFKDGLVHVKGALAAARTGDDVNPEKRSSGSQFYIVQGRKVTNDMLDTFEAQKGRRYNRDQRQAYEEMGGTPFLDYEYTVFGRVIDGLDVIDKIAATATGRADRPLEDVSFKVVVIK